MSGMLILEKQKPPVLEWFQRELRNGYLRPVVEGFVRSQPEPLDAKLVQVEEVTPSLLRCRIPYFTADHESLRPFRADVVFDLDPLTGTASRRNGD